MSRGRDPENGPGGGLATSLIRGAVIAFSYSTAVFVLAATLGLGDALDQESTVWIVTSTGIMGFLLSGHFRAPTDESPPES